MSIPSVRLVLEASWSRVMVVAHRGASSTHPENSLAAFEEAVRLGADAAECDVHMSRDGVPVVIHDGMLDRTTSLKGAVAEHDAAEMAQAGVPSLDALTDRTRGRIPLVIELKGGDGLEEAVTSLLRRKGMQDQVVIFGFDRERIRRAKRLDPSLFAAWLVDERIRPETIESVFERMRECSADALSVYHEDVSAELAATARERNTALFGWTAEPGAEADRLAALKVNFIITNHPGEVMRQVRGA